MGEQLKELYGPLLSCVTASKSAYDAMVRQVAAGDAVVFRAAVQGDKDGASAVAYRTWVEEVLLPLSERAARLVVERADLLEGSAIEPLLLQLVAHVSAYKVILRQWREGSKGERSAVPYPDEVHAWVQDHFKRLKHRQSELLGIAPDDRQATPSLARVLISRL